jgi:hypothetical protein
LHTSQYRQIFPALQMKKEILLCVGALVRYNLTQTKEYV